MASNRSGCGARLPQFLIIIIVATLLAAGLFLAIPYLQGRPEFPRGTYELLVEGNIVRVAMDPEQEVYLVPIEGVDLGTGGQLLPLATATPAVLPTAGPPVGPTVTAPVLPTAAPPTVTPIPRNGCVTFTSYTVQPGDTLYSISRKFVTSIQLMAKHGISSSSLIPGAVLSVPVGDPSCCAGGWQPYVVMDGDTWFGIASFNGVTTDALLQGNGLTAGATLYLASVICVP